MVFFHFVDKGMLVPSCHANVKDVVTSNGAQDVVRVLCCHKGILKGERLTGLQEALLAVFGVLAKAELFLFVVDRHVNKGSAVLGRRMTAQESLKDVVRRQCTKVAQAAVLIHVIPSLPTRW